MMRRTPVRRIRKGKPKGVLETADQACIRRLSDRPRTVQLALADWQCWEEYFLKDLGEHLLMKGHCIVCVHIELLLKLANGHSNRGNDLISRDDVFVQKAVT